jgi:hypothetical protein
MYNLDDAVRKLNFHIDLAELDHYYQVLKTKFEHMHWTWEKNSMHLDEKARNACVDPSEMIMHGWPLQSNMADATLPASMLKSKYETVPWYDTELMFGVVKRLKETISYSYRWTLFVLPPGGRVVRHTDQGEYVVHLPLYWENDAVFVLGDDTHKKNFTLPATGCAYVVDVEIPHETENKSNSDRVGLIFRLPRDKIDDLFDVTGKI